MLSHAHAHVQIEPLPTHARVRSSASFHTVTEPEPDAAFAKPLLGEGDGATGQSWCRGDAENDVINDGTRLQPHDKPLKRGHTTYDTYYFTVRVVA